MPTRSNQPPAQQVEEILRALNAITSSTHRFHDTLQALLALGVEQFELSIGILSHIEGTDYRIVEVIDPDGAIHQGDMFNLENTYCSQTIKADRPVGFEDAARSEWHRHPAYAKLRLEAYLGTAVRVSGALYGTLHFSSPEPRPVPFTTLDKELLTLLAQWVSNVLAHEQAEEALHESEERFRALFREAGLGIAVVDLEGHAIQSNPALQKMLGYSGDELRSMIFSEFTHPEDLDEEMRIYHQLLTGEQDTFTLEKRYLCKDGRIVYATVTGSLVHDPAGTPWFGVAMVKDITERKQIEEEREALIQELERKNEELERFTYTVSHDLKSPLLTIKSFLGYLRKDALKGNVERLSTDIAFIDDAADKMAHLLDDLLELSRIGRLMNPSEAVDLVALAHEAVDLVQGQVHARSLAIDIAPDMPAVYGDRGRLLEVFQNIIDNALKYMGEQTEPLVEVGAARDGADVLCWVRDNGIGINPRYHDKVFGLFERLDARTEGSGIGLAIVKRIVDVHRGHIWVESEGDQQGSTFFFILPTPP